MEWKIESLEELQHVAHEVCGTLTKDAEHATLLTLQGELGAGKTAFTKALANTFGVKEHVTSPTFVIAKQYDLVDQEFSKLIHIDAYRLEEEESLAPLGFSELLENPENVIVLEWPERVEDALPEWRKKIVIEVEGNKRHITYGT